MHQILGRRVKANGMKDIDYEFNRMRALAFLKCILDDLAMLDRLNYDSNDFLQICVANGLSVTSQ
jgi:hypothetical protein